MRNGVITPAFGQYFFGSGQKDNPIYFVNLLREINLL